MDFTADELFRELGKLYMVTVKLSEPAVVDLSQGEADKQGEDE